MQEIGTTDDPQAYILQFDLLSPWDRFRQCWIVGKLHGRSLCAHPVFEMTKLSCAGEANCLKLGTRECAICGHGDSDIKCGARFGLLNLERYAADNRVRHACLRKHTGERQESRTLGTFISPRNQNH